MVEKMDYLVGRTKCALSKISVPQCYFLGTSEDAGEPISHDIRGFSHASEKAVAAVVSLFKYADGKTDVRLVASKTKVTPLKKVHS